MVTYRYVPPKRPRKKPLRAAFNADSPFEIDGWHGDGYVIVKAPIPAGIDPGRGRFRDYPPEKMRDAVRGLLKRAREHNRDLVPATPVGEVEPTDVMLLNTNGAKFSVLVLRVAKSSWPLRAVNRARLDHVMSHWPRASICAERGNATGALVIVHRGLDGKRRIVGLVMPFAYAKPGEFWDRIKHLEKEPT